MKYRAMKTSPLDNVAIALTSIPKGETVTILDGEDVVVSQDIPLGHKIGLLPIAKGDGIIRYGEVIGIAGQAIEPGEWIHIHNTEVGQ